MNPALAFPKMLLALPNLKDLEECENCGRLAGIYSAFINEHGEARCYWCFHLELGILHKKS